VLHDLARLPEATDVLGQLVVDHPDHAAGWVQLARAIVPQGFAWEAHGAIARALKAKPDTDTLVAISMVQLTMQDTAAAESTARRAVKLTPGSVYGWLQLGQILATEGKTAEALAAYRRALANDPQNAVAAFFVAAMGANEGAPPLTAPPEYVRALFDGIAEQFDALLVGSLKYRTPQMLERLFSRWLEDKGKKELVMFDAGCGTGLCGLWLAKYRGRLIGVDLSRRMIAASELRGVYDELVPGEVVEELAKRPNALDLIVAADLLVYLGDLARLFTTAATALRPGGVFLLSVEATTDADYRLRHTQRFAHSLPYLYRLAAANNLAIQATDEGILRLEKGADVRGYLLLLEKP